MRKSSTFGPAGGFIVGAMVAGLMVPLLFASDDAGVTTTQLGAPVQSVPLADGFVSDPAAPVTTVASPRPGANAPGGQPAPTPAPGATAPPAGAAPGQSAPPADASAPTSAPTGAAAPAPAPSPAQAELTASDRGVTPDGIKIGVPILDLGSLAQYGIEAETSGLEEQKAAFQSIIDDTNAKGGVLGRNISAVFVPYNPLEPDDMRAACQKMIEDEKVFAVVAQVYYGDPVLCVTERFETPLILDDGTSDEFYQRSNGYLFSTQQGKARAIRNQIWMLHEMGVLEGKTIGALVSEINGDADAPDEALESTLNFYGYELTHEARATSIETLASEISVHVQQMKAKGVDFVILTQTSTLWDDEAERQNWRPEYSTSDFSQKTRDSAVEGHGAHFDGTIGISGMLWSDRGADIPETPATADCVARGAANGSGPHNRGEILYDVQIGACNVFDVFVEAATRVGPDLTRPKLSQAITNLGSLNLANMNAAAFRPGKFDLPETVRATRWELGCKCYKPIGDFVPARH